MQVEWGYTNHMRLFARKVTSLNPDRYKYTPVENALKSYQDYLKHAGAYKSFDKWLSTEI